MPFDLGAATNEEQIKPTRARVSRVLSDCPAATEILAVNGIQANFFFRNGDVWVGLTQS